MSSFSADEDWADIKAAKLIQDSGFALWEAALAQALRDERSACAMEAVLLGEVDVASAIRNGGSE